jgi:hypothetical protein
MLAGALGVVRLGQRSPNGFAVAATCIPVAMR